jgi:DNA-binding NarL/FixJ family response regulator
VPNKIKVLLVEDDGDFAFLISKLIEDKDELEFLCHVPDRAAGVKKARKLHPDVVLMDLNLSGDDLDGIDAAKEIRLATDAKVLLLTSYEKPDVVIQAAKRAFASGYIFKSQCKSLADEVYKTATSRTPQEMFIRELLLDELSPAERGVLDGLLDGDVEGRTASSHKTLTNQKTSIFKKLGVKTTAELLRVFR